MLHFNSFSSNVRRLDLHADFWMLSLAIAWDELLLMLSTMSSSLHHHELCIDSYCFLVVMIDAQRNQVLDHASFELSTYQKHYQSERIAIDVQIIYCDHLFRTLLRQTADHISLYHDSRASIQLFFKKKQSIKENFTIQFLTEHCKNLKIKRNWKRHTDVKTKAHEESDCKELATVRALLKSEIAHKKRELFEIMQIKYFKSIDIIELNRQSCKEESDMNLNHKLTSKILQYIFEERKHLIHSLFKIVDSEKKSWSVILETRLQAISDLTTLCFKREIKRRKINMIVNNTSIFIETENCVSVSNESDSICTLQSLSLICLMCCEDLHLFQNDKMKMYNHKNILQKHFECHHSSFIQTRESSWCDHSACSKIVIQDIMLFKNHVTRMHSIVM